MPPEPAASESVRAQVEMLRRKLLDLTLRNRMLNYRPSKRLGITVLGESSFEVHRMLVDEGKKMSFIGRPDPPRSASRDESLFHDDDVAMSEARQAAEEELSAFLENAAMPVDRMDTKLNTDDFVSELQAKLRMIQREAALANEELGINTLFLTLGTLEWCETDERTHRAPLLYVPVRLERQANGGMRLVHDGSDVGENLPLRAKLAELSLKMPELTDEKSLLDYFSEIESTLRSREDWVVHRDEICLGFFNYEKYAMYVDLSGDTWPADRKPWQDKDLVAMLGTGYPAAESPVGEGSFLDDVRPVEQAHEVYDADSSQSLAMVRVSEGYSIVVEGPPGTGKSQTITNIIAEAVAAGKTVLFVSAKRAALDVVKRRLEEADLGAMCLDLHDKLTNRREFYAEIRKTVGSPIAIRSQEERVARLTELRDRLNAHSRAVNEPLPEFGVTPFTAMARLAGLPPETPQDREGRVPFEEIRHWTAADVDARVPLLRALETRLAVTGVPAEHAFWGAEIDYLDPGRRLDLDEDLGAAGSALRQALERVATASERLRVPPPARADEVRVLRLCAERALSAPALQGVDLKAADWRQAEPQVREVLENLKLRNRLRQVRQGQVSDSAWTADLAGVSAAFEKHADQWHRFLFGEYRNANRTLEAYLTPGAPADPMARRDLVRDLRTTQQAEAGIERESGAMGRLFGVQWRGLDTPPDLLEGLLDWVLRIRHEIDAGQVPAGLLDLLSGADDRSELPELAAEAERAVDAAIDAYRALATHLVLDHCGVRQEPLFQLQTRVERWQESMPRLPEYISLNEARRQARAKGLEAVLAVADAWPLAAHGLVAAFLRSYFSGVVREAMAARPELRTFERAGHEAMIEEFRDLDDFKLRYNRARVRLAHQRGLPLFENASGNLLLLRQQCELQRRHKPIRWVMERAGAAVQRIKPVFMMSPLSVAIHLPPELPPFDLVVFDEASQVKPEDALSAIIRAKQTIVVGDTRQMPPTSFFDRVADDEEYDEEADEATEVGREAAKLESVLSLMSSVALSQTRRPDLRWHYRSLHPSLIQPSNEMFYQGRLVVFPSPGTEWAGRRVGVVFHPHPETVYEPGARRRVNRGEAELVADAVLRHVREHPQESLMVAAMNKPQADLIFEEVAKRERHEPEPFARFRAAHPHEPLAVKNLENVQGDERDVVFISVTYGRDAQGTIRQQFGPLLKDGGERRLNVLISRARLRCEVFSNLRGDDLRADPSKPGVYALQRYLKFAETEHLDIATKAGEAEESPFDEEVAAALREHGYAVDPQIGSEGYRIDLGVRDPDHPGRYVLGIECDGATYHSARSARDRDKLRQRILESRGWRLHRIWSHDWWQDRDGEIGRLLAAIKDDGPEPGKTSEEEPEDEPGGNEPLVVEASDERDVTRPYEEAAAETMSSEAELREYLTRVVEQEGPIHHELLVARIRTAGGYGRVTRNLREWLEELITDACEAGTIQQSGDAYFANDTQLAQPRDWSARPAAEKKTELVPSVELEAALRALIANAYGVAEEAAVRGAYALMGFRRVGAEAIERGREAVQRLVAAGVLHEEEGLLRNRE
jgi:very-short-patch-repair endonuclease